MRSASCRSASLPVHSRGSGVMSSSWQDRLWRGLLALPVLSVILLGGCSNLGFYMDSIGGHLDLMSRTRPLDEVLAEPDLDARLRQRLLLAQQVRRYASEVLLLPDNDSYRSYADLGRPYAVWNVVATEPYSVTPRQWCFLFSGCVSYRGYHAHEDAEAFAARLAHEGLDIHVAGARAYSTLGWFDDPLLSTMMDLPEARFIGVIFHELAHQLVYVEGDSAFNESFAAVIAREGVRRWYADQGDMDAYESYLLALERDADFHRLLVATRERLAALYAEPRSAANMARAKAAIFAHLKGEEYRQWKARWNDYAGYDSWMAQPLNNAHLALVATYHGYGPSFTRLLAESGGDLRRFYNKVTALAQLAPESRRLALTQLVRKD